MEKDPVCGMQVNPSQAAAQRTYQRKTYHFCSPGCAAKFDQDPQRYVASSPPRKESSGS
jgi:Cu+-exporting ATPase